MSRNKSMMPEETKNEIAKELGVYDRVKTSGWGEISSKTCGNIVKKALEKTEEKNNPKDF